MESAIEWSDLYKKPDLQWEDIATLMETYANKWASIFWDAVIWLLWNTAVSREQLFRIQESAKIWVTKCLDRQKNRLWGGAALALWIKDPAWTTVRESNFMPMNLLDASEYRKVAVMVDDILKTVV